MDVRQLLEAVKKDEIDIDTAVNKLKDGKNYGLVEPEA